MINSLLHASISSPILHTREKPSNGRMPPRRATPPIDGVDGRPSQSRPSTHAPWHAPSVRGSAHVACAAHPPFSPEAYFMDNILLAPWSGPHGGLPPFDHVNAQALERALAEGVNLARTQFEAIAQQKEPATFANTLVALEKSGRELDRARRMLDTYTSSLNDKDMQALESRVRPTLAAFDDEFIQNAALFGRIKAVQDGKEKATLDAEQQRLVGEVYRAFVRSGAALSASDKTRLKDVNQKLSVLYTQFGQNLLKDESEKFLLLTSEADLAGLPQSLRDGARAQAQARGHAQGWLLANTRSSIEPFLTYAERADLREKAWRMYVERGEHEGASDNKPIITQVLALRRERAKLLGYASTPIGPPTMAWPKRHRLPCS